MKKLLAAFLGLMLALSAATGAPVIKGTRSAGGGGGGPPPPTGIDLELGANIGSFHEYEVTPVFVNPLIQGFGLIDLSTAGSTDVPVAVDSTQCPNADFEAVTQFFPKGQVGQVVFRVTGNFNTATQRGAQSGDTVSVGAYDSVNNFRDVTVTFTAAGTRPADAVRMQFSGTRKTSGGTPGTGVAGIVAARPGYNVTDLPTQKITNEFKTFVNNIKVLRLMDMQLTNGKDAYNSQGLDFTKRPTLGPCTTGRSYLHNGIANPSLANKHAGLPLEMIEALATETGKDLWLHIPLFATDTFITSWITHLNSNIPTTTKIYLEWVNEIWNSGGGFDQYTAAISEAAGNVNGLWGVSSFHLSNAYNHWTALTCNGAGNAIIVTTPVQHPYTSPTTLRADGFNGFNLTSVTTTNISSTQFSIPATCTANASIPYGEGAGLVDDATTSNLVTGTGTSKRILQARDKLVVRRTKEIADLTRAVVGDANMMTRYRPVFAWQAGIDQNRDYWNQLTWLRDTFTARNVNGYLYAIAGAPYYNLDATRAGGTNIQTSSDPSLTVQNYIDNLTLTAKYAKKDYGYEAKAGAALHFGIESIMYEGGPDIQGDSGATNNAKKNQVNVSASQVTPYLEMINDAMMYGTNNALYVHYFHNVARDPNDTNAGTNTWFWDADSLTNTAAGKWQALLQAAQAPRPLPERNIGLGTIDCRLKHGNYEDITPGLLTGAYPNFSSASLSGTSHNQIYILWYEQATTPTARTLTFNYTNNFAGWQMHFDVNGTRIAASQALNPVPADLTTVKTLGPYNFTSQPGMNGIEIVKAAGGSGVDVECRSVVIN